MNPLSGAARQLRQLKRLPLVSVIDDARWQTLVPHIRFMELEADERLFCAGSSSDTLFMVIDGELGLDLPCPDSDELFRLQVRSSGATAGDFALVNGTSHLVHAVATRRTRIATFPRFALDLLTDIDPAILAHVYDTAAELSRSVMLTRLFLELFGTVPADVMHELLSATTVRHYRSGERLFDIGDEADGLHFVVSGRLIVEAPCGSDARLQRVAEVRAPESVGELALLSGGKRSASVTAARESTVALLPRDAFQRIVLPDAALLGALTRLLVHRQLASGQSVFGHPLRERHRTFVVMALDEGLPIRPFLNQLKRGLRAVAQPLVLDAKGFDILYGKPDAAQTPFDDLSSSAVAEWLDDKEGRIDALVYVTGAKWDAWAQRIVNRADRILLVADAATHDPGLRELERRLAESFSHARLHPRAELVLVHAPEVERPSRTERWLNTRHVDDFHHVRLDDAEHFERLARRMTGRARGLVFSGGGARGYAHLGVQRLIEERAIGIDCIGGSSMGGLLGAAMAMGHDHASVAALSERFASRRALFDYTLPLVSLMASRKLTNFCREVYGDARIEDQWTPFFAISSNLANGRAVVHDRGPLWQVVRSSISLPGLFSPMPTDEGDLLIDGAVLDTFPVHTMLARLGGLGELVGVNVSQIPERFERFAFGSSLSGWRVLWSRIWPFASRIRVPRVAETLLRATDIKDLERIGERRARIDILIEPDVSRWSLLDFKHFRAISDVGYQEAARVFACHGHGGRSRIAAQLQQAPDHTIAPDSGPKR